MKIENFVIKWQHSNNGTHVPGSTQCIITHTLSEVAKTYSGLACKHKGDNYNSKIGRLLSFKRAVAKVPSKNLRKLLWDGLKEKAPSIITKGSLK
jgi:hypothetical protein